MIDPVIDALYTPLYDMVLLMCTEALEGKVKAGTEVDTLLHTNPKAV